MPSEVVKLNNFYSKISDLYFKKSFLSGLISLLYSTLWEGNREVWYRALPLLLLVISERRCNGCCRFLGVVGVDLN